MSIDGIRFRMEGDWCVLQVCETTDSAYYGDRRTASWRDARATDLLEVAKFTSDHRALADRVSSLEQAAWHRESKA